MKSTDTADRALESAVMAVRRGARLVRRRRYDPPPLQPKENAGGVTEVDLESERLMRRVLAQRHPDHSIIGEEGCFETGSDAWVWYLDPLDGTRAFVAGQDASSVAATLTHEGVPLLAAVAAPFAGELYTAMKGRPTLVNGHPTRVGPPRPLSESEILLYYDAGEPGLTAVYAAAVSGEIGRLTVLAGSFILSACRAARGGWHGLLCVKRKMSPLMPWDLAPAALVLAGSGGVLSDLEGQPVEGMIPARELAAGSPEAVGEIIRRFGERIRDPHAFLSWARGNETVFARIVGLVHAASARGGGGPCFVGISGAGGGIGKTSLARELAELLGPKEARIVSLDDYLLPRLERDVRGIGAHDPSASDLARAASDLAQLKAGETIEKPVYDHLLGRATGTEKVKPARFVIVEGVQSLHPLVSSSLDLGVFLDASPAVRLRRVQRDREEKNLTEAYARAVHERFEADIGRFLMPLRASADVVLFVEDDFSLKWVGVGNE